MPMDHAERYATNENIVFTGYDDMPYEKGDRIEIHPSTDLWIRGARFGRVIGSSLTPNDRVKVRMDALPQHTFAGSEDTFRKIR